MVSHVKESLQRITERVRMPSGHTKYRAVLIKYWSHKNHRERLLKCRLQDSLPEVLIQSTQIFYKPPPNITCTEAVFKPLPDKHHPRGICQGPLGLHCQTRAQNLVKGITEAVPRRASTLCKAENTVRKTAWNAVTRHRVG